MLRTTLIVSLLALGCSGDPVKEKLLKEMGNEAFRWETETSQWGQGRVFDVSHNGGGLWGIGPNKARSLLSIDPPKIWRVPRVQTLVLAALVSSVTASDDALPRWRLDVGAGGARTSFLFDAERLQQVSVPAATVRLGFYLDALDGVTLNAATLVAKVNAFVADGNTSTSPAQYTAPFNQPNGVGTAYAIPPGATAFRLTASAASGSTAFDVNTVYSFLTGNVAVDSYTGTTLATLHATGDFIPIVGGAQQLFITRTGAGTAFGSILYQLDL